MQLNNLFLELPKSLYIKYVLDLKYVLINKMELAITKISRNGQIVIPAEIRKDAGIKPMTKFFVLNNGGNILLKQIKKESLANDLGLVARVKKGEDQIKKGKCVKIDSKASVEEMYDLLMG